MARRLPTRAWSGEPGKLLHWPAGADLGHRCSGGIARLVTVPPTIPNLWSAGSALLHGASQPSAGQRLTRPPSSRPGSGPRWRCTRRPLGGRCGASVLPSGIEDLPRGLDRTPAAGLIFSRRQSAACVVLRLRLRLRARHLGRLLGRLPPPRRDLPAQPAVAGDGHRWGYGPGGLMHPVATLSISAPADLTRAEAGTRWPMQEFLGIRILVLICCKPCHRERVWKCSTVWIRPPKGSWAG